ncbi:TnsA endonuclease N-terminal domain-containing protein [Sporolactobacillus terrae]|uniref:Heteromeric transposase endonuclease subunit TnsA n=1 Tax=Sporolactobacillus terrae TaxID=269673 RepID=A0A5K7WV59_9BACL|nr:TnsA endonuclease N-terminal domain-containing protein [Sporolactobacillus terrae]BBN97579.1 hypothetical protein St703_02840 [Sporolactobacillus terrae]
MAKHKNSWTEDKIARYYEEGRGSGELSNYKPWLTIQNVPSSGRVHRIKGWKTSRIHHLLSDLERNYFYLLEWADNVIDIREQYPLNREITVNIAANKQISHPIDPSTQTPIVMTTDFFITIRKNERITYIARTIKPSEKLENPRIRDKFEIECTYWQKREVDWGIVTEKDIPKEAVKNIGWMHSSYQLPASSEYNLVSELSAFLQKSKDSILLSLRNFDKSYRLEDGTALSLFKYLLARKSIIFDVKKKFSLSQLPADLIILNLNSDGKRAVK